MAVRDVAISVAKSGNDRLVRILPGTRRTLLLLYLFPIAASLISDATIARHLQQIGPMPAGLDVQATIGVNSLPLTPWQGIGVVALWTAGALLLGASVLEFRDA